MKRHGLFLIASLAVAVLGVPAVANADAPTFDLTPITPGAAAQLSDMAPVDEEFGQYHLTPLGVRNAIAAAGARFSDASSRDDLTGGSFALAIDAIRAWEHAYPRDPWVARNLARVAHTYARLHSDCARDLATRTVVWLERDYPNTNPAKNARAELDVTLRESQPDVDATFASIETQPSVPAEARDEPVADVPPVEAAIPSYATAWDRYQTDRGGH